MKEVTQRDRKKWKRKEAGDLERQERHERGKRKEAGESVRRRNMKYAFTLLDTVSRTQSM